MKLTPRQLAVRGREMAALLLHAIERDRLVALKKAKKKLVSQKKAAEELGLTERLSVAKAAKPTRSAGPVGRKQWCRNFDLKKAPKIWQVAAK